MTAVRVCLPDGETRTMTLARVPVADEVMAFDDDVWVVVQVRWSEHDLPDVYVERLVP